ncbi:MAG: YeeE/YedE family protein [Phyllobacteriaceae bacterium]|nr:YeeE/YedE family protein [Phyllobacteriaceae bacterium]
MNPVFALFVGLAFGLGLCLSGMTSPAKVQGFLDLGGAWDPSLAFVMGGAIAVGAVLFRLARRRLAPVSTRIDRRLVAGSLLFGIGWGLVGYCPGPALAAIGSLDPKALAFVAAMIAGVGLHRVAGPIRDRLARLALPAEPDVRGAEAIG